MKDQLNNTKVARLKSKSVRYEIRDTGERGLILRVGKKGDKIWEVFVHRGKKRQRVRLGTFPALDVPGARVAAVNAKMNVSAASGEVKTVADLFELYRDNRKDKMRAWRDVQSVWDCWIKERIGHFRLTDLNVHHGRELRDHVTRKSSEVRAGAVIRYIRPMFGWAVEESLIEKNPWIELKSGAVAEPRDRVLNTLEWECLWQATFEIVGPLGPLIRVLMLSGQRLNSVSTMQWDEIHGDIWTIPKEKMKATRVDKAKSHEVPLSTSLADIISRQPRIGPYVFTVSGNKPFGCGSQQKVRIGKIANISNWRLHDIRRTAATIMTTGTSNWQRLVNQGALDERQEKVKVTRFIVERILGHSDGGVTAIYDRSSYRDEKREGLEVLAASVSSTGPRSSGISRLGKIGGV